MVPPTRGAVSFRISSPSPELQHSPMTTDAVLARQPADRSTPSSSPKARVRHLNTELFDQASGGSWRHARLLCLMAGDLVAVVVAAILGFAGSTLVRQIFDLPAFWSPSFFETSLLTILLPATMLVYFSNKWGHYTRFKSFWFEVGELVRVVFYSAAFTFGALFLMKTHLSRLWIINTLLALLFTAPLIRQLVKRAMSRTGIWFRPLIVVGTGKNAEACARTMSSDLSIGYQVAAHVTIERAQHQGDPSGDHYRAGFISSFEAHQQVLNVAKRYRSPHVLYTLESLEDFEYYNVLLDRLILDTENVIIAPPVAGIPLTGTRVLGVLKSDSVFLRLENNLRRPMARLFKRGFDLVMASLLVLLLSPVIVALYIGLMLDGGKPVFAHTRIGRKGKPFQCLKFRSMVPDAAEVLAELLNNSADARAEWQKDFKLRNDPRITRLGNFLRKSNLDELPQLWNVLKGEMSLVGPRPIVADEIDRYGDKITYYEATWPGMTGLWQTSGRNDLTYSERVSLDVWYVRNWSLWQDLVVLLNTFPLFIRKNGAY